MSYDSYRILLDEPASLPGLGFPSYAASLADIITTSQPRFAIGIFGGWGSGKTTLMHAIEERLENWPEVVTLWFNAWRFEREENMIVPLIDVLREALSRLAENDLEPVRRAKARAAADRIARAGRALLAGVTVRAVMPGVDVELEASKVIEAFERAPEAAPANVPLSFYHAGFTMLDDAIKTFVGHGADRIVVFVDDLDRCLPSKALEVLESMKVFFDTKGVVFVVGLDRNIVERAVQAKFDLIASDAGSSLRGIEYLKKIFQVPFALPRITTSMLGDYLDHVVVNGELSAEQKDDFGKNVRPHLAFLTGDDSVNPREVKRLINAYTIQLKMLGARMPRLDPNVVLALQCLSFRPDWEALYDLLISDPALFQQAIRDARSDPKGTGAVWFGGERVPLPVSFRAYLDGRGGALINAPSLEQYVAAVEATRSADPGILQMQVIVARLRREIESLPDAELEAAMPEASGLIEPPQVDGDLSRLFETVIRYAQRYPDAISGEGIPLETLQRQFPKRQPGQSPDTYRSEIARWSERAIPVLDGVYSTLREFRRRTTVGASQDLMG